MSEDLILGRFEYCLNVKDIRRSFEFYTKLGFKQTGGNLDEGWAIVKQSNCILGLFQGHIVANLLNFRGADVFAVVEVLKSRGLTFKKDAHTEPDGSAAAELLDPDGNVIYFNTFPGEEI